MIVKDRIRFFCKNEKISILELVKSLKVANGYVNSISKSIGIDKISSILEKYTKLNLEWLLTGKSEILKDEENSENNLIDTKLGIPVPVYNIDARVGLHDSTDITIDNAQYIERYALFDGARKGDISVSKKYSNLIKDKLKEKGLTQTWPAKQFGMSFSMPQAYVCNRKQPNLATIFKVADLLEVSPKDLVK